MTTKIEDLLKHMNGTLEGGFAGTRKRVEAAVGAAKRPTSQLSLHDPVSDKMSRVEGEQAERKEQEKKQEKEKQEKKPSSMQDILDYLNKSEEEEKENERLEGKKRIIESIGDGISSIAHAVTAAKGSDVPLYEHNKNEKSLSERGRERYEKLRKERELRREKYLNAAKGLYKMQWDRDRWKGDLARKTQDAETRAKNAEIRAKEAEIRQFAAESLDAYRNGSLELKRDIADIDKRLKEGRITLLDAQAELARVKAENERNGYTKEVVETEDYVGGKVRSESRRPNKPVAQGSKKGNPMSGQNGKKKNPMS